MAPRRITLAFVTLVASAPLLGAAAEPAGSPSRPTATAAAEARTTSAAAAPTHVNRTTDSNEVLSAPSVATSSPTTPFPMNLPDDATAGEVKGEYGIGVGGLVIGTVLIAAIIAGVLYVISRRNWSTSH